MKFARHLISSAFLLLVACNQPPGTPAIHIGPYDPTTTDDLVAYIDVEAPDPDPRDTVQYTYTWYQDGVLRSDLSADTVPADQTTKGEAWRVIVLPSDGDVDGTAAEDEVVVVNSPPVAEVTLSSAAPLTTEDVVAAAAAADADDDAVVFSFAWTLDGAATAYTQATLPADATTKGDVWQITVTPNDGEEDGEPVSASVSIENSLPVVVLVTISPDPARESDTIEASVDAGDDDGDDLTFTYAWSVDGAVVQDGEDASLTGERFDKHQDVLVTVTPNDGWTDGAPLDSNAVTIANTPPAISGVALDPSTIYESTTITCSPSGWVDADGDSEGYFYTWTVNGSDIGVSDDTLDGTAFDKGDEVACSVTPCDDDECGDAVASDPAPVLNTPPVLTSAALSTTSPREGDTISVTPGTASDDDGDALSYRYAWFVDGVAVGTTDTITGADFDKGDTIYAVVTPHDGEDDGASVTSDTATAVNTPPEIASVALSPTECFTDDTLTASVSSSDADGDSVSYSYAWYLDGSSLGTTGSTLAGALHFDKGQAVYVEVTPSDGEEVGATVSSSETTILNSPPPAPGVSIEPAEPVEGEDDLVCLIDTDSTDADGDTVGYTLAWTVDGAAYAEAVTTWETGDTVPASDTTGDEVWTCSVTPNDGEEDGEAGATEVQVLPVCDGDGDGYDSLACGGEDCDDADIGVNPGAVEGSCDGIDTDCSGLVDDGASCDVPVVHLDDASCASYEHAYLFATYLAVDRQTWSDARTFCQSLGYDLLVINDECEWDWVEVQIAARASTTTASCEWWTGLYCPSGACHDGYEWIDGSSGYVGYAVSAGLLNCIELNYIGEAALAPVGAIGDYCSNEQQMICESVR